MELKHKSPARAWLYAVKTIISSGNIIFDGDQRLREITNLTLRVEHPLLREEQIEKIVPQKYYEEVFAATLSTVPFKGYGYSYGERIFEHKGINQLKWVIEKLRKNPHSKSATIGILMPGQDTKGKVPCMCLLDFKIRNGKLNMTAVFRSHDYGTKALPNLIALGELMKKVSDEIKAPSGELICHSISAHIYENEYGSLKELLNQMKARKARALRNEAPPC